MRIAENPILQAWRTASGTEPPNERLAALVRIMIHAGDMSPSVIGMGLFVECVEEIKGDPDTYNEELQRWADYQLAAKPSAAVAEKSPADELPDCECCSSTTEYHPPIITRNGWRQFDPSRLIGRD